MTIDRWVLEDGNIMKFDLLATGGSTNKTSSNVKVTLGKIANLQPHQMPSVSYFTFLTVSYQITTSSFNQ